MKKNKGFSLIETLLSLSLLLLFLSVAIAYTSNMFMTDVQVQTKVDNYVALNRYLKCDASLYGKKTIIMMVRNKVEAIMESSDGTMTNISSLQPQLENLNESVKFSCPFENAVTYLPNGAVEQSNPVTMIVDENTNKVATITIQEFNEPSVVYTNSPPSTGK